MIFFIFRYQFKIYAAGLFHRSNKIIWSSQGLQFDEEEIQPIDFQMASPMFILIIAEIIIAAIILIIEIIWTNIKLCRANNRPIIK